MLAQPPLDSTPETNSQTSNPQTSKQENKSALFLAGNSLLIFVAVYGTFGALVSSFSLTVEMNVLFWGWVIGAVIASTVTMRYRGKGLIILFGLALLLILFFYREFTDGFKQVANIITGLYNRWLSVPVFFPEIQSGEESPTVFITLAGFIVIILLSFTICLRRSLLNTILITAPFVFLTFVITDLQADLIYLFCLIAVYLSLLICGSLSPDDYIKRGRMILPAFTSAMVLMLMAYILVPYGSYSREENIAVIGSRFRAIVLRLSGFGNLWQPSGDNSIVWFGMFQNGTWQFNTNNVNIAGAGQRLLSNQSLLEITVDKPGTFYIRGYSMRDFNGRSWSVSDKSVAQPTEIIAKIMPAMIADIYAQINLENPPRMVEMRINRTGDLTPQLTYQPYYTGAFLNEENEPLIAAAVEKFYSIDGGYIHRLFEELERNNIFDIDDTYDAAEEEANIFRVLVLQEISQEELTPISLQHILTAYTAAMHSQGYYTRGDEQTALELRQMAVEAGIDPTAERTVIADGVAKFVMSSGSYSLAPDLFIPQDENFALYFLQNAQEGYCIHFATAAVMMLRALDVPARFTSGYVVTVPQNQVGSTVVLTDKNAHSWVEVFYDDIGWLYLEVTPSGGNSAVPLPSPHTPVVNVPATPVPQPTPTPALNTPPPAPLSPDEGPDEPSFNANGGTGTSDSLEIPDWLYNIVIAVAIIVICSVSIIIRRTVMKKQRENHFGQRNTNTAAIHIWRYIIKLSGNNEVQPGAIEDLALKARFSQHRLTGEERAILVSYAKKYAEETYNRQTGFGRFWMKYIRALY